jgi:polyhydroxybutyrate depolymerase
MPDAGTNEETDASTVDAPAERSSLVVDRPYDVRTPSTYDANVPTPLVVLLHGYTATAKIQDGYFLMSALAERKNFLLALPDGTVNPLGENFWNATDACCDGYTSGVDDVAYLKAVIEDMKSRFNVDPKRIYAVGHSNGGFMAHRLACDLSADIAGIVSLAGGVYADASKCSPVEPVAVLQVHGDQDETVIYEGGAALYPTGAAYPSAKNTAATWAKKNGCSADLTDTGTKLDLDTQLAGAETTVARHACTKGAAELWTIVGGPHIPSFDETWGDSLYEFLAAHPKP